MFESRPILRTTLRHIGGLLLSVPIGFLGGAVCGAVILSVCGLAGRSGTTGAEYVGYWSIWISLVGAMYGGPLGAFIGPIGYSTIVRKTGFKQAILPAAIGTVLLGSAGACVSPLYGVPAGIVGFFIGLLWLRFVHLPHRPDVNPVNRQLR